MFYAFVGLLSISALLSFLNKKFLKLPDTNGVMILAIFFFPSFLGIFKVKKTTFRLELNHHQK